MFENNLLAGVSGQGGAYSIEDSLRFNDDDSAYLSRTPASAGNRKTWTWSGWVKRGNLGITQVLFSCETALLRFESTDKIFFYDNGITVYESSSALYRDVSGWYHVVFVYDTTNATTENRLRLWVNGEETTFTGGVAPLLNYESSINKAVTHTIGCNQFTTTQFLDGYLAEINFIDGQALTADDFGEIDETTGEWSPKKYSGTYGTNGFYLPFDGNANDDSGNGNNWTENNLASTDYMIGTPTNNFNVFNVIASAPSSADTYEEGNLEATNSTVDPRSSITTIPVSSGKWYAEFYYQAETSNAIVFGVITDSYSPSSSTLMAYLVSSGGGTVGYSGFNGNKYIDGVSTGYGSSFTVGDIIGVALNLDDNEITFYKNNVSQGVITSKTFSGAYNFFTASGTSGGGQRSLLNAGQDSSFAGNKTRQGNTDANGIGDFYYAPPAGYLALCTDNLPEPTIVDSESHFNVVTYTGTGTTLNVTGVGFQPDLVWMKRRDSANSHDLIDVVRGDTARLFPNLTDAELSDVTFSFDSDGFSPDPTKANENAAGGSYVAWCWKAGGTAVTNTDGAINSQVSANVDAGFSIATYTGNSSTGTIGHGLSKKPELVIIKNRGASTSWYVGSPSFGTNNYLLLNSTSAMLNYVDGSGGAFFNYGGWTDSVVNVYNNNSTSINSTSYSYVMYSFHSVEGFSKFGTYVGNGSADGPFVYTGFKPAFVMVKASSTTGNWCMFDDARNTYNEVNELLNAEASDAEYVNVGGLDFLSNGFKQRNTNSNRNSSGTTYIYMAFAEHPFNYATGR